MKISADQEESGAIGKWMYQVVGGIGIDPDQPGYKHVIINPRPGGGLSYAKATHQSMYGTITSAWKLEGETIAMEVEIPANTSAAIHIPGKASDVLINGSELAGSGIEYEEIDGATIGRTGSGKYTILSKMRSD